MKIAIAGSHGVGKTTFAKALAKKLNFSYIHDIVREEAIPKGFVINENTPAEVQF
jgi:cytidylate kinase